MNDDKVKHFTDQLREARMTPEARSAILVELRERMVHERTAPIPILGPRRRTQRAYGRSMTAASVAVASVAVVAFGVWRVVIAPHHAGTGLSAATPRDTYAPRQDASGVRKPGTPSSHTDSVSKGGTVQPSGVSKLPNVSPPASISSCTMFDASSGVALDKTNGTWRLVQTADGGQTWQALRTFGDVVPPQNGFVTAWFSSLTHGFVTWTDPQSSNTLHILALQPDGTWKATTVTLPMEMAGVASASFPDANDGWLLLSGFAGAGSAPKMLVQSTDGGQTWAVVKSSSVPSRGISGRITFQDAQTGWLTVPDPAGVQVTIYETSNGGVTWTDVSSRFAIPASLKNSGFAVAISAPVFTPGTTQGIVALNFFDGNSNPPATQGVLYHTNDGGKSWSATVTDLNQASCDGQNDFAAFLNAQNGWTIANGHVYSTADGGVTWKDVSQASIASILQTYPRVLSLQFTSKTDGWLLVAGQDSMRDQTKLLHTTDGGAAWSSVTG